MVYLDNAATTAMSEVALSSLMEVSTHIYGNPSSVYRFGRQTKRLLEGSRKIIADCIGAEPEEIYFTSCGTESDNWVMTKATDKAKKSNYFSGGASCNSTSGREPAITGEERTVVACR